MKQNINDVRKDVYEVVRSIPKGKLITYGQIAKLIGRPHHARLVGKILSEASSSLHLPCHRVVNSQGWCAPCWPQQIALLQAEGVVFKRNSLADIKHFQWHFMDL